MMDLADFVSHTVKMWLGKKVYSCSHRHGLCEMNWKLFLADIVVISNEKIVSSASSQRGAYC